MFIELIDTDCLIYHRIVHEVVKRRTEGGLSDGAKNQVIA